MDRQCMNERKGLNKMARQPLGTGQDWHRRHDRTVGQAEGDPRSGEAVAGLSAQISKKFVGHMPAFEHLHSPD
jgi:hypothetical protein